MKSDKQKQAKTDLLRELESLREQLSDPDASAFDNDHIPLLLDRVEKAVAAEQQFGEAAEDLAALQAAYQEASNDLQRRRGALPGQQSLFESAASDNEAKPGAGARPVARGENPFLPKHIRDRLEERRQALADDIAQASSFFPAKAGRANTRAVAGDYQALVDELVAEYLPRIERELRARLLQKLEDEAASGADQQP